MKDNKIKIFGEADCYGLSKKLSYTIRASIEMIDDVDEKLLKEAVKKLEKRFEYLKVTLKKNAKEFYYVKNDSEWVVLNTEKPIDLNGEISNYHLIAFSYKDKSIYINSYHGQLDGTGVFLLAKGMLYYYCTLKYGAVEVPDAFIFDGQALPGEADDAYQKYFSKIKALPKEKLKELKKPVIPAKKHYSNVMQLEKMGVAGEFKKYASRIVVSQQEIMKYCSSYDGSPVSAIALMLSESIKRLHENSSKEIVAGIPVNLRPAMGITISHSNTYSKVYVPFTDKIRSKDFESQGTIFRGMVIRGTDKELLRYTTFKYCQLLNVLSKIPLTFIKRIAAKITAKRMMTSETFDVTYVGKCELGEIRKYINGIYPDVDASGLGLLMIIYALDEKIILNIDQDWEEREYIESFLEELKRRNISYEVVDEGNFELPKMLNI